MTTTCCPDCGSQGGRERLDVVRRLIPAGLTAALFEFQCNRRSHVGGRLLGLLRRCHPLKTMKARTHIAAEGRAVETRHGIISHSSNTAGSDMSRTRQIPGLPAHACSGVSSSLCAQNTLRLPQPGRRMAKTSAGPPVTSANRAFLVAVPNCLNAPEGRTQAAPNDSCPLMLW